MWVGILLLMVYGCHVYSETRVQQNFYSEYNIVTSRTADRRSVIVFETWYTAGVLYLLQYIVPICSLWILRQALPAVC